jgi:UDP-sugar transporter A1/2/3
MIDELMKLVFCFAMLVYAYRKEQVAVHYQPIEMITKDTQPTEPDSPYSFRSFFVKEVLSKNIFQMAVPAICYTVQKNLLFVAVSNLDAATYQVAYQGKILTTALFSVILLGRKLSWNQILALLLLLAGVALVQLSSDDHHSHHHDKIAETAAAQDNHLFGYLAVLGACFTSGFASIYFEWVLKGGRAGESAPPLPWYDIWVRNFQLAMFASSGAALGVAGGDHRSVEASGLLQGFTPLVWLVVFLQAFGGIVTALVIKFADNILKNFATAVSIVSSVVVSTLFLGFDVTVGFVIGASLVMAAVVLYTSNFSQQPESRAPKNVEDKGSDQEPSPEEGMASPSPRVAFPNT